VIKELKEVLEGQEQIVEALQELTKQVGKMAEVTKQMKETHDKWVRAGKF
jgi:hypothetical protein